MDPLETLSNEHGLIRQFLDNLEQISHEFVAQREKHGGDVFERCHKLVVDMGSILAHLH